VTRPNPAPAPPPTDRPAEPPRGGALPWVLLILGLLGLSLTIQAVGLVLALREEPVVVEDYYQKGLEWDDHMAQEERNARLGWRLALDLRRDGEGRQLLEVTVRDRAGAPVEGAAVRVEAFHNARAARVLTAELAPAGSGRYAAPVPIERRGQWRFRFDVERGEDRFTASFERTAEAL